MTEGIGRLEKWLPEIDAGTCDGCGRCVESCGPGSLALVEGKAVLVRSGTCGSEEHCIEPCPRGAIRMAWLEAAGDPGVGVWRCRP